MSIVYSQDQYLDKAIQFKDLKEYQELWDVGFEMREYFTEDALTGGGFDPHYHSHHINRLKEFILPVENVFSPVEVKSIKNGIQIQLELPHLNADNIDVMFRDNVLNVVEKEAPTEDSDNNVTHTFYIEANLNFDDAVAEYKDSILTITLPFDKKSKR